MTSTSTSTEPAFRTWRSRDLSTLVRHANNRKVWINLRDHFPHPYTEADAEDWIGMNSALMGPPVNFAIDLDGEPIGNVGIELRDDVYELTGEIGFWIAEPYWGRGIGTSAARFITEYALTTFPHLIRLQAQVFGWNIASTRVLHKAAYKHEATLARAVAKADRRGDLLVYARFRDDVPAGDAPVPPGPPG